MRSLTFVESKKSGEGATPWLLISLVINTGYDCNPFALVVETILETVND